MKYLVKSSLALGLTLGLGLPGMMGCHAVDMTSTGAALAQGAVLNYKLSLQAVQRPEQLDESVQSAILAQIDKYKADLRAGTLDAYYKTPVLSLAMRSEDEANQPFIEQMEDVSQTGLVFGQLLVFDDLQETPQVLPGQYLGGRFYFTGSENSETLKGTVYLLFLNLELEPVLFKGNLASGQGLGPDGKPITINNQNLTLSDFLANDLLAGSEGSYFTRGDLPEDVEARLKDFMQASRRHAQDGEDYQKLVRDLKLISPSE